MPRPRKANKVPKTSVSISVELWETVHKKKPVRDTMDEYLNHVIEGYYYLKENYGFLEQVYEQTCKKNDEYVQTITELRRRLGSMGEPSRGAAVIPNRNQSTHTIEQEVIQ